MMLGVLYAGAFLAGFCENLMNMALVSVMAEFGVDSISAQWLVTGYMIVTTVMVTLAAFLYRRFKLRTLFFAAAVFLFVGSAVGFASSSYPMLLAARLVQSCGSGMLIPLMMSAVLDVAPKNRLGTYMSIGGCMITFGPALAPVVCGSLVTAFGWHSIFLVPLAAVVVLAVLGAVFLSNLRNVPAVVLDAPSVALSAVGLTALPYGLVEVSLDVVQGAAGLAVAVIAIAAFVVRQLRCRYPLMDLTPMKSSAFWPATILVLIAMMSTFSTTVLLPLYLEGALGMTAATAGLVILVPVLVNAGCALVSGRIMDSKGEWPLIPIGFACIAAGFAVLALTAQLMSIPAILVGALLVFVGVGMTLTPAQTAGLRTLSNEMHPFGVSIMTVFVQIAACIGPSLFTGVLSSAQAASLAAGAGEAVAVAQGFSTATWIAAAIGAAGTVVAVAYALAARRRDANAGGRRPVEGTRPATGLTALMQTDFRTVSADAPVGEAMALLVEQRLGGLPVVDGSGAPVGFVSDGDIMRYLADKHPLISGPYSMIKAANDNTFDERLHELIGLPVGTIATGKVVSVDVGSSLEEVCTVLANHRLKKVPVVENGAIVGTLNRSDVLRYAMGRTLESV